MKRSTRDDEQCNSNINLGGPPLRRSFNETQLRRRQEVPVEVQRVLLRSGLDARINTLSGLFLFPRQHSPCKTRKDCYWWMDSAIPRNRRCIKCEWCLRQCSPYLHWRIAPSHVELSGHMAMSLPCDSRTLEIGYAQISNDRGITKARIDTADTQASDSVVSRMATFHTLKSNANGPCQDATIRIP